MQHVGALAHEVRTPAAARQVAETRALDGGKIEFQGAGHRINAQDGVTRRDEQVALGELHAGRARTAVLQPEIPRQLLILPRCGGDAPDDEAAAFEREQGVGRCVVGDGVNTERATVGIGVCTSPATR